MSSDVVWVKAIYGLKFHTRKRTMYVGLLRVLPLVAGSDCKA